MTDWSDDLEDSNADSDSFETEPNTEQASEQAEEAWDTEGRLFLEQPEILQSEEAGNDQIGWILYHQARLNVEGLYGYPSPRITPPMQLCSWPQ